MGNRYTDSCRWVVVLQCGLWEAIWLVRGMLQGVLQVRFLLDLFFLPTKGSLARLGLRLLFLLLSRVVILRGLCRDRLPVRSRSLISPLLPFLRVRVHLMLRITMRV